MAPFDRCTGPYPSAREWVVGLALSELGTREKRQNRGPRVDPIVTMAGGNVDKAPPWCAYFVSAVGIEARGRGMELPGHVRSGAARKHWQRAPEHLRLTPEAAARLPDDLLPGLVFVRTRSSAPVSDVARILRGEARAGHTGIVIGRDQDGSFICVAGNSSGAGHSRVSGTGSVALERYGMGSSGWVRMVGFIDVAGEATAWLAQQGAV